MEHEQRVRREFARQAELFGAAPAIADGTQTRRIVDAVAPEATAVILDLACGPGLVTAALAPLAHTVIAFDLTPEMLDAARRRCVAAGLANVRFEPGSATALPFEASSFDVVVTRLAIHHFTEPDRVLRETWRVLKPGGRLVIADVVSAEDVEQAALQNAIERLRDPSHVRMLPASELSRVVAEAGFAVVSESQWDRTRELEEWFGIVGDAERVAPLRTVVHALAVAGVDAGMGLALADGAVTFVHHWRLIVARKPSA